MMQRAKKRPPADDDIDDICAEFGIDAGFVQMTWEVLKKIGGTAPGSKFFPRNKRECALGCCVALAGKDDEED